MTQDYLPVETEYGTDAVSYDRVTDLNAYMQEFRNKGVRVPTSSLSRIYKDYNLQTATTSASPYVLGIMPFAGTLVMVKHVVETVSSAATIEVESSSSAACMTADAADTTVQTATLATAVADREFDQGDVITVKIATGSGSLIGLAILLVFEPIR